MAVELKYVRPRPQELCDLGFMELPLIFGHFKDHQDTPSPPPVTHPFYEYRRCEMDDDFGAVTGLVTQDHTTLMGSTYFFFHRVPDAQAGGIKLRLLGGRGSSLGTIGEVNEVNTERIWTREGNLEPTFAGEARKNMITLVQDDRYHTFSYHPDGITASYAPSNTPLIREKMKKFNQNQEEYKYYQPDGALIK
jgi:hypothetical protein